MTYKVSNCKYIGKKTIYVRSDDCVYQMLDADGCYSYLVRNSVHSPLGVTTMKVNADHESARWWEKSGFAIKLLKNP